MITGRKLRLVENEIERREIEKFKKVIYPLTDEELQELKKGIATEIDRGFKNE